VARNDLVPDLLPLRYAPDEDGIQKPVLVYASRQFLQLILVYIVAQLVRAVVELFERYSHNARLVHRSRQSRVLLRLPVGKG
jgi:hypothetical protein